jgi:hypothetical protein
MALRHSASFLQTFHTAQTAAQRTAESQTATPTDHMDTDPAALAFVRGQAAKVTVPGTGGRVQAYAPQPTDGSYVCEILGHKVRCGGAYVSEKQARWIIDIATTRETPGPAEAVLVRLEQGFAKSSGSQFITTYKDLPKKSVDSGKMVEAEYPVTKQDYAGQPSFAGSQVGPVVTVEKFHSGAPKVADGRYAVEHEGTLKFYKVKNGRKPGYVFLDVQASDDWHSIRTPRRIHEILALIAEDELTAARRYGQELGKCSRCGRTLTDETSRAYGIGPDCRNK